MPEYNDILINPDVRELQIGVRGLRKVTVYPLSVRDQLKTTSIVTTAVTTFFGGYGDVDKVPETEFAIFVSSLISGNLDPVVHMVLADEPPGKDLLEEMTNRQLEELIKTIYEVNYSFLSSLFQKMTDRMRMVAASLSTKSSPMSAIGMGTGQPISTESPSETEGSLFDKPIVSTDTHNAN